MSLGLSEDMGTRRGIIAAVFETILENVVFLYTGESQFSSITITGVVWCVYKDSCVCVEQSKVHTAAVIYVLFSIL